MVRMAQWPKAWSGVCSRRRNVLNIADRHVFYIEQTLYYVEQRTESTFYLHCSRILHPIEYPKIEL